MRGQTASAFAARAQACGTRPPQCETPETQHTVALAVQRAQAGDRDALRFLYVRYAENVRGYVRSIVHDEHDAEDITQLVFAKLMTVIVKYDDRSVPFFSWLLRVARNAAIDHIRTNRSAPVPEVYGAGECAPADGSDCRESLEAALSTLPDEQRSVVLLRHVVGLTPGEIGALLGRTDSSVHGLHHRGRRALQRELTRLHACPSTQSTPAAA